ncbi:MAG: sigma-70 family RNA polymerase sigma factor [Gammaproteobacteria bacterium]|nr:sigma-70 family RNA polymerase sigma factor [Gammaproteobacteria bacterium]
MSKPDDTDLVQRSRKGDSQAFEALLIRYEKPVYNAAYRMLDNADDARDVTQTVFLKAYEHLDDFNPKYRFFSWVYRIALNESVNCLNKRSRTEELTQEPETKTRGPDAEMEQELRNRQIQSALMTIKPDYRTVIVLKHFMDCNYLEISEILDIPEKKVKSRLYSGRQLLKEALANRQQM